MPCLLLRWSGAFSVIDWMPVFAHLQIVVSYILSKPFQGGEEGREKEIDPYPLFKMVFSSSSRGFG